MFQSEKITDILKRKDFTTSVEIFPPRNGKDPHIIFRKLRTLKELKPDFISITKGAMGSMRGGTVPIGYMISDRYEMNALVHFRCRELDKREVENLLVDHAYFKTKNILAVLGDPLPGEPKTELDPKTHNRYACELVQQISDMNKGWYLSVDAESEKRKGVQSDFCIGVAAYPEAEDMDKELFIMGEKVKSGADFAITQMVFDADVYADYVKLLREKDINIPVIPGIRPVMKEEHVKAAEEIFSANVPEHLKESIKGCTPEVSRNTCIEFTVNLCRKMKENEAPGVHLFILNDVKIANEIIKRL